MKMLLLGQDFRFQPSFFLSARWHLSAQTASFLCHQKGKCFDVRNKGISLNACYEGKGNIEVKLVDEAGFSVSGVYSANDFLNGPINLNNVVQNRGE